MAGAKDVVEWGKWAWENRKVVAELWAIFRRWWKKSRLLVIGPGGTGKTTLARMLSGEFDWLLDSPWSYNEDVVATKHKLRNDSTTQVVVLPGQTHRQPSSWAGIGEQLATGHYRGVILVTAFGYQSLSQISYKEHRLYDRRRGIDQFRSDYLTACRIDEVECLRKLSPFLQACNKKLWLLSLVAKQDLWFSDPAVERWYGDGEYGQQVAELCKVKSPRVFRHERLGASHIIGNFITAHGEILKKNTEGFDHQLQIESVRRVIEVIDGLRKWESEK